MAKSKALHIKVTGVPKSYHSTITGCINTEPRIENMTKNRLNIYKRGIYE